MLPEYLNEQQTHDIALAFAERLNGVPITQALEILQELAPQLILNAHTVNQDVMVAARARLFSGGRV